MPATSLQFEDLLSPIAPEAFLRETWEKQPLVVRRSEVHYAGLLSICDVDKVIAFSRPKFTDPNAFRASAPPRTTFVRGLLADQPPSSPPANPGIAELRQVYDRGKSVVIMAMQHRWPPVAELCRNLEMVFHCPVHANMYLTPGGSQGFAAHFDTHEVFVLQLEGVKHWRLYGPSETLPLVSDRAGLPKLPLGPSDDVRLKAGDLLYIPRGHVHEAFTSDGPSLHLTVGINVYRWADLLHHALASASRIDARFRESVPGGALPSGTSDVKHRFRQLLELLATGASSSMGASGDTLFDQALRSLGDQFFDQLNMLPGEQFAAQAEVDRLDLESVLENRCHAICRVVQDGDEVAIEFPGNRIGGPRRTASAMHYVAAARRFAVRDLPDDLSDDAKLVLARRLLREGLLARVKGPAPIAGQPSNSQMSAGDGQTIAASEDAPKTRVSDDQARVRWPPAAWESLEPARHLREETVEG